MTKRLAASKQTDWKGEEVEGERRDIIEDFLPRVKRVSCKAVGMGFQFLGF